MDNNAHSENAAAMENSFSLTLQQQQRFDTHGNKASCYWLSLNQLDKVTIKQRLHKLMAEHSILSTRFIRPQGFTSLRQNITAPILYWNELDSDGNKSLAELKKEAQIQALETYRQQISHLSVYLISHQANNYLLLTGSSLALDDGSIARIYDYLIQGGELEPVDMQYSDYGEWITELLNDEDAIEAVNYWEGCNFKALSLLILNEKKDSYFSLESHDAKQDKQGNQNKVSHIIPVSTLTLLENMASALQSNTKDIMLSVWAALLNRLSGLDSFYLHYYHDSRDDYEELADILGVFSQGLPVTFENMSLLNLEQCLEGLSTIINNHTHYQEYIAKAPVEDKIGFQYIEMPATIDRVSESYHNSSDLFLNVTVKKETEKKAGELQLYFDTAMYTQESMQRALAHFLGLLEAALSAPQTALAELPCLLADEYIDNRATQENTLADKTTEGNYLLNTIYQHAVNSPDVTAIRYDDTTYTYEELWQLSDKAAANLQTLGAKPESIVALSLPRSAEFLISLVAIFKTGAAYLPIDPALPQSRIAHIIEDANPVAIIADKTLADTNVSKQISWSELINNEAILKPINFNKNQLAYVLYTSGSTGVPKGVQVSYASIMHYSLSAISALQLPKAGHYALISSLMADLGNTVLFPAWLQGGTLHLLTQEAATDGQVFARYCDEHPIDCLKIVPSHFSALLSSNTTTVVPKHSLVFGGEKIDSNLLKQLHSYQQKNVISCRVYNHYGPTETTVGVLWGAVDLASSSASEAFKPAALAQCLGDNKAYLLDKNLNPTISGQLSELYISGPNVTRGYLNSSAKTAERFLANPFSKNGEQMYRTGDLAMRSADNTIHIIGRDDKQIKIRGFRLDLGEIETLLGQFDGIAQASVQVEGSGEQANLLAFYTQQADKTIKKEAVLSYLTDHLPEYMIPSQIWAIDMLPLNTNGKLDGKALLAWAHEQKNKRYIAPQNNMELAIQRVWQDILGIEQISIDDNFFEIGGHSLAAIKVVARLRESLGRELPTNSIFQAQTIAQLAAFIQNNIVVNYLQEISAPINKASDAPTLVLMHSHSGHLNYFQSVIDALKEDVNIFGLYPDNELLDNAGPEKLDQLLAHYHQHLLPLKDTPITLLGWSLGARQIVVLADYLLKQGFTISALSLLDYNPKKQLTHKNDEIAQLLADIDNYFSANEDKATISKAGLDALKTSVKDQGISDYEQGLQYLLESNALKEYIGRDVPMQWIMQRVGQRWVLRRMFYAHGIPKVNIPLWVWHGNQNPADTNEWQAHSDKPISGYFIDTDHDSILQSSEFIEQLSTHLVPEKISDKSGASHSQTTANENNTNKDSTNTNSTSKETTPAL